MQSDDELGELLASSPTQRQLPLFGIGVGVLLIGSGVLLLLSQAPQFPSVPLTSTLPPFPANALRSPPTSSASSHIQLVSINTAAKSELMQLPEIGELRADAIIANRPYRDLSELVRKAKLPRTIVDRLRPLLSL